jgi:predicted aconitase/predicted aconitase with swiveling domain
MTITPSERVFQGTSHVKGYASGKLIASDLELSFWGGVSSKTSEIIDRHHPLSGQYLHDNILAIPGGRGSCTGSSVMLELLLKDKGPKAMIFERQENILILGVIVAEEIFGKTIPVVMLDPKDFREILQFNGDDIHINNSQVSVGATTWLNATPNSTGASESVELSGIDRALLNGEFGDASRAAMKIVLRMAGLLGVSELMDVTQVHVDGCSYTGPGCLLFAENLRDWGGKVRVPTSLNSISIDKNLFQVQGANPEFMTAAGRLADAYTDMGARSTFTCAPYQLDSAPKFGDQIAWAESNAVVYANSVLGARTMKYPDFLDICIALTGRAPNGGPHVQINRMASLIVNVDGIESAIIDDSFYPLLGYHVGSLSPSQIPVIVGIKQLAPSKDDMKALGAAFATVSSAPMFHILEVTPEAVDLEAVVAKGPDLRSVSVQLSDLIVCWNELNSASKGQPVDLVSLGNPHFSFDEIQTLKSLCQGRKKDRNVAIVVTCGRVTYSSACQAGLLNELEEFGVQFVTDTCWCMITDPTIPRSKSAIMTNSGKYAHYGPGLTGKSFYFGNLARCVDAACGDSYAESRPQWLRKSSQ